MICWGMYMYESIHDRGNAWEEFGVLYCLSKPWSYYSITKYKIILYNLLFIFARWAHWFNLGIDFFYFDLSHELFNNAKKLCGSWTYGYIVIVLASIIRLSMSFWSLSNTYMLLYTPFSLLSRTFKCHRVHKTFLHTKILLWGIELQLMYKF